MEKASTPSLRLLRLEFLLLVPLLMTLFVAVATVPLGCTCRTCADKGALPMPVPLWPRAVQKLSRQSSSAKCRCGAIDELLLADLRSASTVLGDQQEAQSPRFYKGLRAPCASPQKSKVAPLHSCPQARPTTPLRATIIRRTRRPGNPPGLVVEKVQHERRVPVTGSPSPAWSQADTVVTMPHETHSAPKTTRGRLTQSANWCWRLWWTQTSQNHTSPDPAPRITTPGAKILQPTPTKGNMRSPSYVRCGRNSLTRM